MSSIRAKLSLLIVATVSGAVLVASIFATRHDVESHFNAKREEIAAIAGALSSTVALPLAENDGPGVARALTAVGHIKGVTFARVDDTAGRTVRKWGLAVLLDHPEVGALPSTTSAIKAAIDGSYISRTAVVAAGRNVGTLTIIVDLTELRREIAESLGVAMISGLLAMAFGLVLGRGLQRRIVDPVVALQQAMDDVRATKDFSRRVARTSDDEIGRLVDSFNAMLSEIRDRDEALNRHRQNLEREVEGRTAELAHAKLAAEQANAAKSNFLATMSHEIRTPMNGMLVTAELLASSGLPAQLARHADVIVRSGHHLLTIINDILDLSKIDAGKIELEAVPVAPAAVVDDVLRLFADRAAAKRLDFAGYVSPSVPATISADPVRLTQILSNLVSNALKFTEHGSVSVRVELDAGHGADHPRLAITVADTGPGIPPDKFSAIFDAFAQADQSTTRRYGGTGIGLTITRRIVDIMGGDIEVRSGVGEGSVFRMTLPVDIVEPSHTLAPAPHTRPVVVALRDGATRDALLQALADRGFDTTAVDPQTALSSHTGAIAVFVEADDLVGHQSFMHHLTSRGATAIVALAAIAPAESLAPPVDTAADVVLRRPLVTGDLAACLDALSHGRAALAALAEVPAPSPSAATEAVTFPGVRILAADDSPVNREVLVEALGRLGIEVTTVEDGEAAVAAVRSRPFDLVFMDASMPGMDGFAATRAVRTLEAAAGTHRLPIVALTAHVVGDRADLWRDAGMDDCVTKPFTLAMLRACLERWLGARAVRAKPTLDGPPAAGPSTPTAAAAPETTATAAPPLLDAAVLDSLRAMQRPGDDLVGRVVSLYRTHAPLALATLRERIAAGEPKPIADAAHALKSLSRNIGAVAVGDLCGALEMQARRGEPPSAASVTIDAIGRTLEATLSALGHPAASAATAAA